MANAFGAAVVFASADQTLVEVTINEVPDPTRNFEFSVDIGQADLTSAVNGAAQSINLGSALPAGAWVVAVEIVQTTPFTEAGATACDLDIGITGDLDALVDGFDARGSAAGRYRPLTGGRSQGDFAALQLKATFTPDSLHNLLGLTAGAMTIKVVYSSPEVV